MSKEQKTETRITAADIKKQIEEVTRANKVKKDIQESGMPITGMIANEINASESTPAIQVTEEVKSEPQNGATKGLEVPASGNPDFKDWAKKKGIDWTTDDSVLAALHKSDQEFHKRQAERKAREATQNGYTPQPPYQAPAYQSPTYIPPTYQTPNARQVVESIARQYNMLPEDVERLSAFNRDFFEVAMRSEREKQQHELEVMRVENKKNSVFRELSSDPVFRRPEVAVEFHNVLDQMQETDPQSFENDPTNWRRAYDRALSNLGRRYLEGRPLQEGVPPSPIAVTPPTTPPRPLGQISGGGSYENENAIDANQFAKLSLADKKKVLEGMGLRPEY